MRLSIKNILQLIAVYLISDQFDFVIMERDVPELLAINID